MISGCEGGIVSTPIVSCGRSVRTLVRAGMAQNPLLLSPLRFDQCDRRQLQTLDLGFGSRRVLYGRHIEPRIVVGPEHLELPLLWHGAHVLGALKLSDTAGE